MGIDQLNQLFSSVQVLCLDGEHFTKETQLGNKSPAASNFEARVSDWNKSLSRFLSLRFSIGSSETIPPNVQINE